jgi:aminoglycoside phosphotransferase (APT) family kinase protein
MSSERLPLVELISDEQILSIVHAAFGNQTEIIDCQYISAGHNNTLYDIKTINPDHHMVLRIAPRDDRLNFRYERDLTLTEPVKYRLLSQAEIPTGRVLVVDGSKSVIDRNYIILDYINAVPLNHPSVPAEVRPYIMRKAGEHLATMHSITTDKFGWITPDGSIRGNDSWAEVFGELMIDTYKNCRTANLVSNAESDAALECFWNNRAAFDECRVPALTHNDIWDPNIMVKEKDGEWQIEAIIDMDGALFADREFEFAIWEGGDPELLLGYKIPPDKSPNAMLRKKFYRMQLYIHYSWFYLVYSIDQEFQATAKKVSMDILKELL